MRNPGLRRALDPTQPTPAHPRTPPHNLHRDRTTQLAAVPHPQEAVPPTLSIIKTHQARRAARAVNSMSSRSLPTALAPTADDELSATNAEQRGLGRRRGGTKPVPIGAAIASGI
ncbi:hypothetical protein [Rhodococcus qingshengii]|uniref:hypothetical protein n=1 Tax=Rhodococcus qingshengii TaxID=334542 RepID=UPI001BEB51E5|nr:hypothetical protein [Rhodococcus qingshengii]MBT2275433.1 hypothetical protein [Rhodococcus qingshengii]